MNTRKFFTLVGDLPYFDLATLVQLTGEKRGTLLIQLSRWMKQGHVVSLRRGMYAPGAVFRRHPLEPEVLANQIYAPSYLSFHWALGYYDMIPEAVFRYTSATSRVPRVFENELGQFQYTHLKQDFFFGYHMVEVVGGKALIAAPEKALLDLWHIHRGEWTVDRMAEMRFQNFEHVDDSRLEEYGERSRSPRLRRAIEAWKIVRKNETDEKGQS